jgi:hypothetical protein
MRSLQTVLTSFAQMEPTGKDLPERPRGARMPFALRVLAQQQREAVGNEEKHLLARQAGRLRRKLVRYAQGSRRRFLESHRYSACKKPPPHFITDKMCLSATQVYFDQLEWPENCDFLCK